MTNYQNDIMDLLGGDTPKKKYEYLKELIMAHQTQKETIRELRIFYESHQKKKIDYDDLVWCDRCKLKGQDCSCGEPIMVAKHLLTETKNYHCETCGNLDKYCICNKITK